MLRVCDNDYKAEGLLTFCLSKKPGSVISILKNTMLVAKTMHSIECLVGRAALKFLYGGTQGADASGSGTGGWRLHLHGRVPNTEQTSVSPLQVRGD